MAPRGFTLLEITITIGIAASLFLIAFYGTSSLRKSFTAQMIDREITHILTIAEERARMGMNDGAWGVYIPYSNATKKTETITLFQGDTYASRNQINDRVYSVNNDAQFTYVDFSGSGTDVGGDHEIVFQKLSGETAQYGSITLTWFGTTHTILISKDGMITRSSP